MADTAIADARRLQAARSARARLIRLALLAGAGALTACGQTGEEDAAVVEELVIEVEQVRAVDGYRDLGGDVTALAFLAYPNDPGGSRALAGVAGQGVAILDLFNGEMSLAEGPAPASLIAAPEFSFQRVRAPLIVGAGGELDAPQVYLYVPGPARDERLAPVLADPIAPDLDVVRLCPVRVTDALVEFIAVGASGAAQHWRLRDENAGQLTASLRGDAPAAEAARACARAPDGVLVTLDAEGRLDGAGPPQDAASIAALRADIRDLAVLARPQIGDLGVVDRADGRLIARLSIEASLNAPAAATPDVIAISTESFGGAAYRGGVALIGDGDSISVTSLEQLLAAVGPPPAPEPNLPDD